MAGGAPDGSGLSPESECHWPDPVWHVVAMSPLVFWPTWARKGLDSISLRRRRVTFQEKEEEQLE